MIVFSWKTAILLLKAALLVMSIQPVVSHQTCIWEPECSIVFEDGTRHPDACRRLREAECHEQWLDFGFGDLDGLTGDDLEPCTSSQVQFEVASKIHSSEKLAPYLRLNLTISALDKNTRAIGYRFICIHEMQPQYCAAPSDDDSDHIYLGEDSPDDTSVATAASFEDMSGDNPLPWIEWIQKPCRLYDFRNASNYKLKPRFPISFSSACIGPIVDGGVYRLNARLYPQNCSANYYIRVPTFKEIAQKTLAFRWKPILWIDLTDQSGVWIMISRVPKTLQITGFEYRLINATTQSTAYRYVVDVSESDQQPGFLFKDVPMGNYSVAVSAINPSCNTICLPSILNFTLYDDHIAVQKPDLSSGSLVGLIAVVVFSAFVVLATMASILVIFLRRRSHQIPTLPDNRPKVFMLYTDDFEEHRLAVINLATYLRECGQCDVILDEWEFRQRTSFTPESILRKLSEADYFLIIFSDGSQLAFDQSTPLYQLKPERAWAEIFVPAMRIILGRLLTDLSRAPLRLERTSVDRYLLVRFEYSSADCMPQFLVRCGCPTFQLHHDTGPLLNHIHGARCCDYTAISSFNSGIIERCYEFMRDNPDWLIERRQLADDQVPSILEGWRMEFDQFWDGQEPLVTAGSIEASSGVNSATTTSTFLSRKDETNDYGQYELYEIPTEAQNGTSCQYPLLNPDDSDVNV